MVQSEYLSVVSGGISRARGLLPSSAGIRVRTLQPPQSPACFHRARTHADALRLLQALLERRARLVVLAVHLHRAGRRETEASPSATLQSTPSVKEKRTSSSIPRLNSAAASVCSHSAIASPSCAAPAPGSARVFSTTCRAWRAHACACRGPPGGGARDATSARLFITCAARQRSAMAASFCPGGGCMSSPIAWR